MKKLILAIILIAAVSIIGLIGCEKNQCTHENQTVLIKTSGGVELYANPNTRQSSGRLENINDSPVLIREIFSRGHGEITVAFDTLNPGETLSIATIYHYSTVFYVYNIDGGLIGWLAVESIKPD